MLIRGIEHDKFKPRIKLRGASLRISKLETLTYQSGSSSDSGRMAAGSIEEFPTDSANAKNRNGTPNGIFCTLIGLASVSESIWYQSLPFSPCVVNSKPSHRSRSFLRPLSVSGVWLRAPR